MVTAVSPQPSLRWSPDVPEAIVKRSIKALSTVAPGSIDDSVSRRVEPLPILYGGWTGWVSA